MALKSTVFKVNLSISDVNRGYYEDHALTLARHPSETDLRMIMRVVVFAMNAHEYLQFTKGLSETDEPDLWQKDLTGDIEHWIELGQPTEKRIRQACGKSRAVSIFTYQKSSSQVWFDEMKDKLTRFQNLKVVNLNLTNEKEVPEMMDRSMTLTCVIDDQSVLLTDGKTNLNLTANILKG